ncbi:MAG: hypothetical protein ACO1PW_11675 [Actinomycetota bacterium]
MTRPAVPAALPPGWGVRPPALDVLRVGGRTWAVADEAVVLGRLLSIGPPCAHEGSQAGFVAAARGLVAEGASLLEVSLTGRSVAAALAVAAPVADLGLPVVVAAGTAETVRAVVAAGAAAVVPTEHPSDELLATIAGSSCALLLPHGAWPGADPTVLAETARRALAAGLPSERVLVDVAAGSSSPGAAVLGDDPPITDTSAHPAVARGQRSAAFTLAIARGARLLRTTDPRTARRASVALAAIRRAGSARHRAPA